MRLGQRRILHQRRADNRSTHRRSEPLVGSKTSMVAIALILLLAIASYPLLSDDRLAENLTASLRYWAGTDR
ncbi:MAG: hypothetical protein HQ481_04005 [Alphaproteobacteria bacterium]|nr:hypothetical protein [Alphaproteobacteria bacterium]